jgi:hypothetical protein
MLDCSALFSWHGSHFWSFVPPFHSPDTRSVDLPLIRSNISIPFQYNVMDSSNHGVLDGEKVEAGSSGASVDHGYTDDVEDPINYDDSDFEVFNKATTDVNFRTVSWPRASVIFHKCELPLSLNDWTRLIRCDFSHICNGCS